MTLCDHCGIELTTGMWPFCPHGQSANAIQTNERFIGGVTIENLGDQPVTVYSREEFQAAMDRAGVEQRIKYVPGDKHLTDWTGAIDAKTLENAAILVARQGEIKTKLHDPAALKTYQGSVRVWKGQDDVFRA